MRAECLAETPARHASRRTRFAVERCTWGNVHETDITPSWVGGDGTFTDGVDETGREVLLRAFSPESAAYASPLRSVETMMRAAGRHGLAPKVLALAEGSIVMERVPATWRSAKLDDLADPVVLSAILTQRRRMHGVSLQETPDVVRRSIVADMFGMRDRCVEEGVALPRRSDETLRLLRPFFDKAEFFREGPVACHGDGAASNVLVNVDATGQLLSAPLLTGWTLSGVMDPVEEAGSVLAETGPFVGLGKAEILKVLGIPLRLLPVAEAYAVVDDLLWGYIGLWRSAVSADRSIDYAKYGLWRLEKSGCQLRSSGLAEWLGRL
ncbi:MAG: phosphotransferase [Atopobiaceae bacterium]